MKIRIKFDKYPASGKSKRYEADGSTKYLVRKDGVERKLPYFLWKRL